MGVKLSHGRLPNGRLLSIGEATRGRAREVVCPQCGLSLVARHGDVRSWHFAHEADQDCEGAGETVTHLLAKQIIADQQSLFAPEVVAVVGNWRKSLGAQKLVTADEVQVEATLGSLRPDVIFRIGSGVLAIEICVAHKASDEKIAAFEAMNVDAMEIYLPRDASSFEEDFAHKVLYGAPRAWLAHAGIRAERLRMQRWKERKDGERRRQAAESAERHRLALQEEEQRSRQRQDRLAAEYSRSSLPTPPGVPAEPEDWSAVDAWIRGDKP